ncbi:MAG: GntR family transcriptional regulator [Roseovarius sp.]
MARLRGNTRQNHVTLARRIVEVALERGLRNGDHLPEQVLSQACGVSRTPIRSALKILEENDIATRQEERGFFLRVDPSEGLPGGGAALEEVEDTLAARILKDRAERRISDVQSVSALVRRYDAPRSAVLIALKILSSDGIVTQLPGRAWAFQPMLDTPNAQSEGIAFRLALEPQAILAPGFALDGQRARLMRDQMAELGTRPEGRIGPTAFHRLDCDFHTMIADSAGNRFLRAALLAHQKLRSATQTDQALPDFRMRQALDDHLGILDSLERSELDLAADQMVLHLRRAQIRRPKAANRGLPPQRGGGMA